MDKNIMEKNKICTTIEQSKKLVELGIDMNTADIWYAERYEGHVELNGRYIFKEEPYYYLSLTKPIENNNSQDIIKDIPAWSLSALLELMPKVGHSFPELCRGKETGLFYMWLDEEFDTQKYSNPTDAAFEMIVWLKENKKI